MKWLSLFDGISCGRVALERAGLTASRYVAYEIDQNAINCSAWNWPDIEHKGSVVGADFSQYKGFDVVMGGFPCQDLSIAGNRKGLKGKRSSLFWYLVEAIEQINPRYFLVENNVGMPKDAQATITAALGVEPIKINSALVSAQLRNRLYWTNIPGVEQPEDRGILLRDALKRSAPPYYTLSERNVSYIKRKTYNTIIYDLANPPDKAWCLTATYAKKNLLCTVRQHGGSLRELTPEEFEALQALPEGYTDMIPTRRRYHVLGNGWQVDTVAHILNYIHLDNIL